MGYGEYGGGGSVHWRVVHGDKQQKGRDRDPDPNPSLGGEFVILERSAPGSNYQEVHRTRINFQDRRQLLIVWPPDTVAAVVADALRADEEDKKADEEAKKKLQVQ